MTKEEILQLAEMLGLPVKEKESEIIAFFFAVYSLAKEEENKRCEKIADFYPNGKDAARSIKLRRLNEKRIKK